MTEVDITIELTKEEVRDLILEYNVCFGSGIAYTKYKFDILKDSYNVFISYLVSEVILHTGSILIVKGVNSLDEIIVLSEKLKIENLSLRRVLLPSSTRLGQRKSEASPTPACTADG